MRVENRLEGRRFEGTVNVAAFKSHRGEWSWRSLNEIFILLVARGKTVRAEGELSLGRGSRSLIEIYIRAGKRAYRELVGENGTSVFLPGIATTLHVSILALQT